PSRTMMLAQLHQYVGAAGQRTGLARMLGEEVQCLRQRRGGRIVKVDQVIVLRGGGRLADHAGRARPAETRPRRPPAGALQYEPPGGAMSSTPVRPSNAGSKTDRDLLAMRRA